MPKQINGQELQPLLDTQQNQLQLIFDASDGIDTKALALLGTNVALLIFIAQSNVHPNILISIFALGVPFTISLLLDILAIWPLTYAGASIDLKEHPEYLTYDQDTLTLQLLADTKDAIETNKKFNATRWRLCVISLILTGLGSIALIGILIV